MVCLLKDICNQYGKGPGHICMYIKHDGECGVKTDLDRYIIELYERKIKKKRKKPDPETEKEMD